LRLIEHIRSLYRPDDLGVAQNNALALLPLGAVQSLALPGESYKLAFTTDLLAEIYQRPHELVQPPGSPPAERLVPNVADVLGGVGADRGGYVDLDNDGNWWIPSGRVFFSPETTDTATRELAHAGQHFFLPYRQRDPFHTNVRSTESSVSYDVYDLLPVEARDALGNRITSGERDASGNLTVGGSDYRVLQPRLVMDPNRNRTSLMFDALGMVVGSAVMGKPPPAPVEGDSFEGFTADLTEAVVLDHLANPLADPQAILGSATTRLSYDLFAYQRTKDHANPEPAVVYTLVRETHQNGPVPAEGLRIQHHFSYSDGFGREIQKKIQAGPGPVPQRDADGRIMVGTDGRPEMSRADSVRVGLAMAGRFLTIRASPFANTNRSLQTHLVLSLRCALASVRCSAMTRSDESWPNCTPITPGKKSWLIPGDRKTGTSTTRSQSRRKTMRM
jgi:hypothetical protein